MSKELESSLETHFYALWDTNLKQYSYPFVSSVSHVLEEIKKLVNDVRSDFYGLEHNFILFDLGLFDCNTGKVECFEPVNVCNVSDLIDENIRNVQVCIQTLNFLPNGYFKAPKEFQESIQAKIDEAIKFYSEKFIKKPLEDSFDSTQHEQSSTLVTTQKN